MKTHFKERLMPAVVAGKLLSQQLSIVRGCQAPIQIVQLADLSGIQRSTTPWRRKRSKQDLSFFEMSLQTGRQILNPLRKNGVLVHVENVFALFYIVFWTKKCCQPPPNQVRKHQPSSFRQQSWTTNQQWTIINRKPLITTFPSSIIKSNSNHP